MSKTTFPSIEELRTWWLANHNLPEVVQALKTRDELSADQLDELTLAYAEARETEIDDDLRNEFHLAIVWTIAKAYEIARAHVHAELLTMSSLHDLLWRINGEQE